MKYTMILLICYSTVAVGQKCEFDKNEIDEFTGNKVVMTSSPLVTQLGADRVSLTFVHNDGIRIRMYSSVNNTMFGRSDVAIKAGEELYFKFEDEETVKLQAKQDYEVKVFTLSGTTVRFVEPEYEIDDNDLLKFQDGLIDKVRIVMSEKNMDIVVKAKHALSAKEAAKCFIKETVAN